MKKALFLLFVFFTIAFGDNSQRISEIHFEIKSLEDQKPILFEIISQTTPILADIKIVKKQTKTYRDKMQAIIADNLDKTLKTGALNILLEIQGGNNGGKLVELGAWITGKIIGVSMEKSRFFGGVSNYKQKLDGISKEYENLTPELKKLSQLSKSSDEAMRAYYNKYGKYSEQFELGETGVFTTRMRLIAEQADTAWVALENLDLQLTRILEEAQRDLQNIENGIKTLREELEELNRKDKEEKLQEPEKKVELSNEDQQAGMPPYIKSPSMQLPGMPNGCYKSRKNQQEANEIVRAADNAKAMAKQLNESVKEMNKDRTAQHESYLATIKEQYNDIMQKYNDGTFYHHNLDGDAHEKAKQGIYPTGYPFSVFLKDTQAWGEQFLKKTQTLKEDLEEFTNNMLKEIPKDYDQDIAQLSYDRDTYIYRFYKIWTECFNGANKSIDFVSAQIYSPVPEKLKMLKFEYLKKLAGVEKTLETYPKWQEERMATLRTYFAKRRVEMQKEIAVYEKQISEQDNIRSQITSLAAKAMEIYESNDFTKKDASYVYIPKTKMQESVCETISALRSEFYTGTPASVERVEKEIKNLLKMERYYGTSSMPVDAYVEFGADIERLKNEQDQKTIQYSQTMQVYNTSGSNIRSIQEDIDNNRFYQLGLFYPNSIFGQISSKQMQALKEIKSSIKNFTIETENAAASDKVLASADKDFQVYYDNIKKMYKENFGCLPPENPLSDGLIEEIEKLKTLIEKIRAKPKYMGVETLMQEARALYQSVEAFGIDLDNPEKFLKEYQALSEEHARLNELVNTTYEKDLIDVDKRKLNEVLLDIASRFSAFEEHKKFLSEQGGNVIVEELYKNFAQEYSIKNLSSLMSLISDSWQSQSDGTTLMDLEDTLGNSFSIFNEINCNISSLNVQSVSSTLYRVNYVITIVGLIYENDIKHEEKSSVYEEVSIEDGKAKISKTLNGRFWQNR